MNDTNVCDVFFAQTRSTARNRFFCGGVRGKVGGKGRGGGFLPFFEIVTKKKKFERLILIVVVWEK